MARRDGCAQFEMIFDEFERQAKARGFMARDCCGGQWQCQGVALVNWWPYSARRTLHVDGAVDGLHYASSRDVFEIASGRRRVVSKSRHKRKDNSGHKRRLIAQRGPVCHWCKQRFNADALTVDHLVPLSRGGSNYHNNLLLACKLCNQRRANSLTPRSKPRRPHERT